jgi:hypothetical protein
MSLQEALPFLLQYGGLGAFAWVLALFYRSAIDAHKRAADTWEKVAAEANRRADLRDAQLLHILGAVKTVASAGQDGTADRESAL